MLLGLAWIGVLIPLALGLLLQPDARGHGTHEQLGLLPCYPMARYDIPCPGCGVTTSVVSLVRGDLLGSLRTQPLGTALVLAALLYLPWAMRAHLRGRDLWHEVHRLGVPRLGVMGLGLLLASWFYKLARVRGWL